jgi:hypothetical protein
MAEGLKPMKQLQELLQDEQLRQRLSRAEDEREAVRLLSEAGAEKGHEFGKDWLTDVIVDIKVARPPAALGEHELMELARTYMEPDTPPKLCHTYSCGGHPQTCCRVQ